jgi:hypothetical protein
MNPVKELILYNLRDKNKFINFINETCNIDVLLKVEETEMRTKKKQNIDEIILSIEKNLRMNYKESIFKDIKLIDYIPKSVFRSLHSTTYHNVKTINGYHFDICKSALQKYIRRGLFNQALFFAAEMDMFRFIENGKSSWTNFYNRIRVIIFEDIGLASPSILFIADSILKKLSTAGGLTCPELMNLVYFMATSKHTRFYSHIGAWTRFLIAEASPGGVEIPQRSWLSNKIKFKFKKEELDCKTAGPYGVDLEDIINSIIFCLENKKKEMFYFLKKILDMEKLPAKRNNSTRPGFILFDLIYLFCTTKNEINTLKICIDWYKTMKNREQFLCVIHPFYIIFFRDILISRWTNPPEINSETRILLDTGYNRVLTGDRINDVDDYVIDMHTKQGRNAGKNSADFAIEGSFVAYDDFVFDDMNTIYIQEKLKQGRIRSEKETFYLKSRAQLNTGIAKQDVYFATEKSTGINVVVKGPYLTYNSAVKVFNIISILNLFEGVNVSQPTIKLLKSDMFETTPLGIRKQVGKNEERYFLISKDVFNQQEYPIVVKESKLWPPTNVVDYDKLFLNNDFGFGNIKSIPESAMFSFLLQFSARYVFEIGDFASRNFIRNKNNCYLLDAENINVSKTITFSRADKDILFEFYNKNREKHKSIMEKWLSPGQSFNDKWSICKDVLKIDDKNIEKFKKNIHDLIENFELILNL